MSDPNKPRRRRKKDAEPADRRIPEAKLTALDGIFPGFAAFYRANYDEAGKLRPDRPKIPGLRPPAEETPDDIA